MKKRFKRIFFLLCLILLIERALVSLLNANILRGDVHFRERLNSEKINWNSIFLSKNWVCKSYQKYIYVYHTCFREFGDVYGYSYFSIRPYMTFSRFFWPTDDNFRYITFGALGYNPGKFLGIVLLNGVWERCIVENDVKVENMIDSYCGRAPNLKLIEAGNWNNDYIK